MTEAQRIAPAPIRKTLRVQASRERAFEIFAARMGSWWMKDHSICRDSPQKDVVIEPHTGGRWYEIAENGATSDWGRVLAWEPPARLALAWQLNRDFQFDPGFETTVEVTFAQDGAFTVVEFEHRDLERFGETAPAQREMMDGGWAAILAGYRASIEG
jgi:uncharacterized protein YndB with AHSA1/START domain